MNGLLTSWPHNAGMSKRLPIFAKIAVRAGLAALIANEARGLILAAPVLYGMYQAGGTAMAIWLGICSLAGILLSVVAPVLVLRRLKLV
jgi:hypothetical protein